VGAGQATDSPVDANQDDIVVPEGQGVLATTEMEGSDIEDILRPSRKRLASMAPQLNPETHSTWLDQCRKYIERRGEPLEKPFAGVSEALLRRLEHAEKTRGGPKGILNKVTRIAHNAFLQNASNAFQDNDTDQESGTERQDDSGEEDSQGVLECVRRMMVLEARIRVSSTTKSQAGKSRKKTARTLSKIPPGGLLDVVGVLEETIPAMARLHIKQYSNALYWKYAPYLDPVRCGIRSGIC
jgi:hypothetical protein